MLLYLGMCRVRMDLHLRGIVEVEEVVERLHLGEMDVHLEGMCWVGMDLHLQETYRLGVAFHLERMDLHRVGMDLHLEGMCWVGMCRVGMDLHLD